MENTEHIKFKEQIGESIDTRLLDLEATIDTLDGKIDSFRNAILDEIHENYTVDGVIDGKELVSIYVDSLPQTEKILEDLGISGFSDFLVFLGIDISTPEIEYADTLQNIEINGIEINFTPPLGFSKKVEANYLKVFQLVQQSDIARYVDKNTKFVPSSQIGLDFTIVNDIGEEIKYTANPEGVFEITKDGDKSKKGELVRSQMSLIRLRNDITNQSQQDPNLTEDDKDLIKSCLEYTYIIDANVQKVPTKYRDSIKHYYINFKHTESLKQEYGDRTVLDEKGEIVTISHSNVFDSSIVVMNNEVQSVYYGGYLRKKIEGNKISHFDDNKILTHIYIEDDIGLVQEARVFYENGKLEYIRKDGITTFYEEKTGEEIYRRGEDGEGNIVITLIGANGTEVQDFKSTQEKNRHITERDYLDFLAQSLDTPQKIHLFFELFMRYVHDDPEKAGADKYSANVGGSNDYWQLATESLSRVSLGIMLGDCDDYAFLAKEILQRQGKDVHVIGIPSHALALWTEQNSNGTWNAHTIGTFGYDKNGNRYGMKIDHEKEKGYQTQQEAINSVMVKYDEADLGLEEGVNYRIEDGKVEVLSIPRKGVRGKFNGGIGDIPIELLNKSETLEHFLKARNNIQLQENYDEALRNLDQLIHNDPDNQNLYHDYIQKALKEISWNIRYTGHNKREDKAMGKDSIFIDYINKYPDNFRYHEIYADHLRGNGASTSEINFHKNEAYKEGSKNLNLIIELGRNKKQEGNLEEALRIYEEGIQRMGSKQGREKAQLQSEIGYLYFEKGDIETATEYLETAHEVSSMNGDILAYIYYRYENDIDKSMKVSQGRNEHTGNYEINEYYQNLIASIFRYENGDFDSKFKSGDSDNIIISKDLLDAYPEIARLYNQRIKALEKHIKTPDAIDYDFETLGKLYEDIGDIPTAIIVLEKALEQFESTYLRTDISVLYLKLGDVESAINILNSESELKTIRKLSYLNKIPYKVRLDFYIKVLKQSSTVENYWYYCEFLEKEGEIDLLEVTLKNVYELHPDEKDDFKSRFGKLGEIDF